MVKTPVLWVVCLFILFVRASAQESRWFSIPSTGRAESTADSLLLRAEYKQALKCYLDLAEIYQKAADKSRYIRSLNRLTDVYIETDSILKAIRYCQMALDTAEKYLPANNPERAYAYKNLGEIYNRRGIGKLAFRNFFKAVDIMLEGKQEDHLYLALIYSDLGYEYDIAWEFNQGIAYHLKALSIIRKYYPEDHPVTATFINRVGDCFYGNNDFKTANIWHSRSLATFRKHFGENHPAVGENLMDIGKNFLFLRVQDSSAFYLQKALPVLLNFYSDHHRLVCHYYEVMGYFHYTFHEYPHYLLSMEKSLTLLKERDVFHHRKIAWVAGCIGNMFKYNYYLSEFSDPSLIDSAVWYNCKAIEALVPDYKYKSRFFNPPIDTVVDRKSLLNVFRDKCLIHKNYIDHLPSNPDEILALVSTTKLAVDLTSTILEERQSEESRAALLSEVYSQINTAISGAYDYYKMTGDQNYLETVFYFSEMNKSRLLASVMNREAAMTLLGVPDSLVAKEKSLNDRITTLDNMLLQIRRVPLPDQDDRTEELQNELFEAKVAQNLNHKYLESKYPEYYHTCFNKKPAGIKDIQHVLREEEALIDYSMIGYEWDWTGRITCFAITQDTVQAFITPVDQSLDSTLKAFLAFAASGNQVNPGQSQKEFFIRAGHLLYKKVLEPFRDMIRGKSLVIIPDGDLYRLPFEILLTEAAGDKPADFRELPYLIRDHAISYAHSASLLYKERSEKKETLNTSELFAMAPVFEPNNTFKDPLMAEWVERGEDFSELKGAQEEIGYIHQLGGGLSITGKDATEEAFKKNSPHYNILHIATHGVVDDRYPMLSKLVFYPDTTGADDGFLNVYELYAMKLNAQLVVLSACNTGYGSFKKGEGVVSLARGFAYSGVPSVVMSLWKVSDRSTARLMKYFYTYLKEGYSKDKALQLAKLQFLGENDPFYSNPHFWAGFVQIGDTVPVKFEKLYSKFVWALLIAFVLAVSGFIYLKSHRK